MAVPIGGDYKSYYAERESYYKDLYYNDFVQENQRVGPRIQLDVAENIFLGAGFTSRTSAVQGIAYPKRKPRKSAFQSSPIVLEEFLPKQHLATSAYPLYEIELPQLDLLADKQSKDSEETLNLIPVDLTNQPTRESSAGEQENVNYEVILTDLEKPLNGSPLVPRENIRFVEIPLISPANEAELFEGEPKKNMPAPMEFPLFEEDVPKQVAQDTAPLPQVVFEEKIVLDETLEREELKQGEHEDMPRVEAPLVSPEQEVERLQYVSALFEEEPSIAIAQVDKQLSVGFDEERGLEEMKKEEASQPPPENIRFVEVPLSLPEDESEGLSANVPDVHPVFTLDSEEIPLLVVQTTDPNPPTILNAEIVPEQIPTKEELKEEEDEVLPKVEVSLSPPKDDERDEEKEDKTIASVANFLTGVISSFVEEKPSIPVTQHTDKANQEEAESPEFLPPTNKKTNNVREDAENILDRLRFERLIDQKVRLTDLMAKIQWEIEVEEEKEKENQSQYQAPQESTPPKKPGFLSMVVGFWKKPEAVVPPLPPKSPKKANKILVEYRQQRNDFAKELEEIENQIKSFPIKIMGGRTLIHQEERSE